MKTLTKVQFNQLVGMIVEYIKQNTQQSVDLQSTKELTFGLLDDLGVDHDVNMEDIMIENE